jgi:hypothetical protein
MTKRQGSAKYYIFLFLSLFLTMCAGYASSAESRPDERRNRRFLDAKVADFQIKNQTLLDALWQLARGPVPFGFGFEKVLKQQLSDPEIVDPGLNLQLKEKSVREILDALCQADPRFTWSADGSTVNVFPRATIKDSSYLLNRRLPTFALTNATDAQNGLLAIARQLPPPAEQIAQAQVGGDDPYPPEPWTITLRDISVREAVNRIAAHGGPCAVWIFGGAKDFRSFGFFNTFRCSVRNSR